MSDVLAPPSLTSFLDRIEAMVGGMQFMNFDLDRLFPLAHALGITEFACPVITVGGTNGKGSVVHGLAAIYAANGYAVAYAISPHLQRINERACYCGSAITDEALLEVLQCVDHQRGDLCLSYYEFITLAILLYFKRQSPDVIILEVGLGGRLDVMNLVANDCAVITSIGLDHTAILGDTREAIAREKMGIFKRGQLVVCGEPTPPSVIASHAKQMENRAVFVGQDFSLDTSSTDQWLWKMDSHEITLPVHPQLHPNNAATIMAVLAQMAKVHQLRTDWSALPGVFAHLVVPGRLQRVVLNDLIEVVLDVSHNADSVQHLCDCVASLPAVSKTLCLFAAQAHKDYARMLGILTQQGYQMHVAGLESKTSATTAELIDSIPASACQDVVKHATIPQAWRMVLKEAQTPTRVIVCGSFYTVAAMLALLSA